MHKSHVLSLYTPHSDEELLVFIKNNDHKAFTELFLRYWKFAHYTVYSKVCGKEVTEEIVQDIFLSIWDRRQSLTIQNFKSYLYSSVKNKALKYIESRIVKQNYCEYYKTFHPQPDNSTEKVVVYNNLMEQVEKAMNDLPVKSKNVFVLNRFEGRSVSEIAEHLNLSEKAIEYHLTRSIRKLKLYLKDYVLLVFFLFQ